MIVRISGPEHLFITQPDHAHLARRVMEHTEALRAHPRIASILLAIGEHDNGWTETDAAPTIDITTGQPHDFVNSPLAVRHEVWPRGITRLAHDTWAAALVAQHAITVYDRFRPDPVWTSFFAHMETLRAAMLRASGGRLEDLLDDYPFVRLGDLISLVFCTGWTDPQHFAQWRVTGSEDRVTVTPGPFDGVAIPLEVNARRLPHGPYRSDDELREKLARAEVTRLRGELR
jgi:Protein of unknown function (DUF3891)